MHTLLSVHATAVPTQTPLASQVSPWLQALPSSQVTAIWMAKVQFPVLALQESAVQALPSLHTVLTPGTQLPPPQTSPTVHALPSVQALELLMF